MTIKGLKWGTASCGFGCGPMPDELVTEVEAEENGEKYFCVVSLLCDSEAVFVTNYSAIGYMLDGDYRPGEGDFIFNNDCDSCWREQVEEMVKGDYEQLIRLGRLALRAYLDDGWETGKRRSSRNMSGRTSGRWTCRWSACLTGGMKMKRTKNRKKQKNKALLCKNKGSPLCGGDPLYKAENGSRYLTSGRCM